jgi:hypothetical protein
MRALVLLFLATLLAGCDGKPQPAVDITGGGKKAMERAKDVSKALEAGAERTREAEAAASGAAPAKKGE